MTHTATPPRRDTGRPSFSPPRGSVDAHVHLIGPQSRYPLIPSPPYLSADALPEDCIAMHAALGIDYGVVVSAGAYGRGMEHLLHVLETWPEHFRGVAVLAADTAGAELLRLDRAGVRGIRFVGDSAGDHVSHIEPGLAERAHDLGWHVQFIAQRGELETHAERLLALPNDLVLDHFGGLDAARGTDQPALRTLLDLLDTGRVWVKLSGPMYASAAEFPYDGVTELARALVRHRPDRLVWGSDWPHLHMGDRLMPDDAALLDLLPDWVPDAAARDAILGANARALYGFPDPLTPTDPGARETVAATAP
ncbi:MAG: amidohydrolase [Microbacteriaceae bacterium]|nr:amidohydrolase [Microbacteriaceae bacterium]